MTSFDNKNKRLCYKKENERNGEKEYEEMKNPQCEQNNQLKWERHLFRTTEPQTKTIDQVARAQVIYINMCGVLSWVC